MKRARRAMDDSDLLLVVVDGTAPVPHDLLEETRNRPRVIVRSKSDLGGAPAAVGTEAIAVSARTGTGLDLVLERIQRAAASSADAGDELMASARQSEGLGALERALITAEQSLKDAPVEVALVDFREALTEVSALIGLDVGDAVLDRIFATFCLGK